MRIIRVIDFLRHKASISGANFVASEEDLRTLEPTSSTWVFGPRTLVDQVLRRADLTDLHIFELVRSDTGHWLLPAHAGGLPLRCLNQSVLGRVVEIGLSPPPMSYTLEHEGWKLLNSALARFRIAPLDAQNGFLEVIMDNMCASTMDCEMEDLDSRPEVPSDTEIIVEGHREVLRARLNQQVISEGACIVKRSQRKSKAVEDGVQLRISGPSDVIETIRSNDTVSSAVGATYSAGVTVFLEEKLWPALFSCLAGSIYSTQVVHESPKWLTIGCGAEDLEQLLCDLRSWRETQDIPSDFSYRRWEVECPPSAEHPAALLYVGHGTMSAHSHRAVASNVAGRISIPAIKQYLKHRNIDASVSISDNLGTSCVELQGDVQRLQGTSVAWQWKGVQYAMTFDPAEQAPAAKDVAEATAEKAGSPGTETGLADSHERHEAIRVEDSTRDRSRSPLRHKAGDIVRVPLLPRSDQVKPDPGLPLDPVHEPTAAVKLLEVRQDKDFGDVWTGIRVHDELAAEKVLVEPKETHAGRYLQLTHALAPEVRLNSNKCSKHYQLPKSGTKARATTEQQVAKDAKKWTETLRKHLREKSLVYLLDASSIWDDPQPSPTSTTSLSHPSTSSNPTSAHQGQPGHGQAERTMWKAARKDASIIGVYTCMSPPRSALLQSRLGARDIFNLSVAVRATEADILAAKLAGGRTGAEEARARLNTSTITIPNMAAT